jgi:hypothetical protein
VNPNGGAPSAAVITVSVVSPAAAGNWVLWGGANPMPTASSLNWSAGQTLANTTVVGAGGRTGSGPGGAIQDFAVAYNGPSGCRRSDYRRIDAQLLFLFERFRL